MSCGVFRRFSAFSPEGRLTKSPATLDLPLTMSEVENALAFARTRVQEAVDLAREMQSLKDAAQALDDHVAEVKKSRPRVISVDVPNTVSAPSPLPEIRPAL